MPSNGHAVGLRMGLARGWIWLTLAALLSARGAEAQEPPAPAAPPAPPGGPSLFGYAAGEGFRLRSEDGDYVLRLALQGAFAAEPTWTDGNFKVDSPIKVLRPVFRGNLVEPWIGYWVSIELSRETPFLLDGYFDLHPWDELSFRFGQQYTPMSRHEAFGPQQIYFPDYARTANYFWSGYERGGTLYGSFADD